jgi:hypothetical protein
MSSYDCQICKFNSNFYSSFLKHIKTHENWETLLQITEDVRMCTNCGKVGPNDQFRKDKKNEFYLKRCNTCSDSDKEYRKKPEVIVAMVKHRAKYAENNHERILERRRIYDKIYREDPKVKLITNMRSRLYKALSIDYASKSDTTKEMLGCTMDFYQQWLEFNFQYDLEMTVDNYGAYWQIDHVKPCKSFDMTNPVEQAKCFHWTNTRPLEKKKNNEKNDKIIEQDLLIQKVRIKLFLKEQATDSN